VKSGIALSVGLIAVASIAQDLSPSFSFRLSSEDASPTAKIALEKFVSPDGRFTCLSVRPAAGRTEGPLSICNLPAIQIENMSTKAVRFGSDGLRPLSDPGSSCGYLAIVEPWKRSGVVMGWVSNVNGCGAFSARRQEDGAVVVTPILDYGPMPGGTSVEAPDMLVVGCFDDCRLGLEAYAEFASAYHKIRLPPNRTGYCTWCSDRYGNSDRSEYRQGAGAGTETSTLALAALAERLLKPYGFEYVQFDDQWQNGSENNGPARDFSRTNPRGPYPNGFSRVVAELNARGFAVGVWFIPFGADAADPAWSGCEDLYVKSSVEIVEDEKGNPFERPVALARRKGDPLKTIWGGECLDMTNPRARKRLADTVRRFTYDWGMRYLKCDGLFTGLASDIYGGYAWADVNFANAMFADRKASNVSAFRKGLETIRTASAPGTFILGCNLGTIRAMVPSFGLLDAMRIGNDNGPIEKRPLRYLEGPQAGTMRYFFNGRVWWNDPDSTYVRASIPVGRARAMASWTGLTDSLFEVGDWLGDLPNERVEILRRTMAHHNVREVRPIDLFEREMPCGWILDGGSSKVVGVFNWSTNETLKVRWPFGYAGLDPTKTYVGYDFWGRSFLPSIGSVLALDVPPDNCVVLAIAEDSEKEIVLSTSVHVAAPVYGVRDEMILTRAGERTEVRTYSRETGLRLHFIPPGMGGWVRWR